MSHYHLREASVTRSQVYPHQVYPYTSGTPPGVFPMYWVPAESWWRPPVPVRGPRQDPWNLRRLPSPRGPSRSRLRNRRSSVTTSGNKDQERDETDGLPGKNSKKRDLRCHHHQTSQPQDQQKDETEPPDAVPSNTGLLQGQATEMPEGIQKITEGDPVRDHSPSDVTDATEVDKEVPMPGKESLLAPLLQGTTDVDPPQPQSKDQDAGDHMEAAKELKVAQGKDEQSTCSGPSMELPTEDITTVQPSSRPDEDQPDAPHTEGPSRPPGSPTSEVSTTPFINTVDLAGIIPFLTSDVATLPDGSIKARPSQALERSYETLLRWEAIDRSQLKDRRLDAPEGRPPPDGFEEFQLGGRQWHVLHAHGAEDPLGAMYAYNKNHSVGSHHALYPQGLMVDILDLRKGTLASVLEETIGVEWPSIIANQSVDQFIRWRRSARKDVRAYDLLHLYQELPRFQGMVELTDVDLQDCKWVELTYHPHKGLLAGADIPIKIQLQGRYPRSPASIYIRGVKIFHPNVTETSQIHLGTEYGDRDDAVPLPVLRTLETALHLLDNPDFTLVQQDSFPLFHRPPHTPTLEQKKRYRYHAVQAIQGFKVFDTPYSKVTGCRHALYLPWID